MWRRGANLEGDTANFIETEQLLEFEGARLSFLQVCSEHLVLYLNLFFRKDCTIASDKMNWFLLCAFLDSRSEANN